MTQTAFTQSDSPNVDGPGQGGLAPTHKERRDFANELRKMTVASRVRHEKFDVRKALTTGQIKEAAGVFDADGNALTMAKKLVDTTDPAYRAVVRARADASGYWRHNTTPYPEPGIRLIRKSFIGEFNEQMGKFKEQLTEAVTQLQAKYAELRERAAQQLGTLFNAADYPVRIDDEFSLEWDFPSIEPPDYLKNLHPHLYEQECERVRSRFEEAVRLTEQALATKFAEMVNHLAEKLSGDVDGKPKVFRDSAVENLNTFFSEFRNFDMGSTQMQSLVDAAQQALAGIQPKDLRTAADTRTTVAAKLAEIGKAIDGMMLDAPKRAISLED